ncbi:MAG: hypothetical protein L6W00_30700 [Lentisphaeria bacterium]|nr:MAG: hypothetical protein L6W00_30700 [Lentisphaeria bacterium]
MVVFGNIFLHEGNRLCGVSLVFLKLIDTFGIIGLACRIKKFHFLEFCRFEEAFPPLWNIFERIDPKFLIFFRPENRPKTALNQFIHAVIVFREDIALIHDCVFSISHVYLLSGN